MRMPTVIHNQSNPTTTANTTTVWYWYIEVCIMHLVNRLREELFGVLRLHRNRTGILGLYTALDREATTLVYTKFVIFIPNSLPFNWYFYVYARGIKGLSYFDGSSERKYILREFNKLVL